MTQHPEKSGLVLYRFYDADDNLLYIGITNNPRVRFSQHNASKHWFKHVTRSTMEHFATRQELEIAEIAAIQSERPKYNLAHAATLDRYQAGSSPRITAPTSDASRFTRPDAIATDTATSQQREQHLDELEAAAARTATFIPGARCPECQLIPLAREHDGLLKCIYCLNMWTPEELEERN